MGRNKNKQRHHNVSPKVEQKKVVNSLGDVIGYNNMGITGDLFGPRNGRPEALSSTETLANSVDTSLITNNRMLLSRLYIQNGLVRTFIDVPVDDALRGGVDIFSNQLDPEQIDKLLLKLDRENDLIKIGEATKWARLYGGAGIIIATDESPDSEFSLDTWSQGNDLKFRTADVWELLGATTNPEGEMNIQLSGTNLVEPEYFSFYGTKVHHTRVLPIMGKRAPSLIRGVVRGWGVSEVESLVRSLNAYTKTRSLIFEVLDEFKLDIYKIRELSTTLMDPDGQARVQKRISMGNMQKNYQNALVMDAEDDYDHKQLTFSGLAEIIKENRIDTASELRMPLTKVFGLSASGFNSGEDDIEVYNSMIESQIRTRIKDPINKIIEIRCMQLFNFVPDDLKIEFKPLRVLSSEQQENVKTQKFNRASQAKAIGEITREEFRDICNKSSLLELKLENDELSLAELQKEDDKKELERLADTQRVYEENNLSNSKEFERASYEADGGDSWIDPRRKAFFENPLGADKTLWAKALEKTKEVYGTSHWQFTLWYYKKIGGKLK